MFYEEWMSSDPIAASRAVRKITDKALLRHLALFGRLSEVRQEALFQLDDPAIWKKAAKEDPNSSVRRCAIRHISDLDFLQEVLQEDSDLSVQKTAEAQREKMFGHTSE